MPLYHIALFKLKKDADPQSVQKWQRLAKEMVGQVPGLLDLQADKPIELTAPMAKGFDMGVVVLLDYIESLATFFTHPSHDQVHELYMEVCEQGSTIAYDIEF
ncbi:putative Stress-response A/B barrel domain-containing protein [Seiridium cardinale]